MMTLMQPKTTNKKLTLDEVRKAVNMQTEYLKANGQSLGERLVNATNDWNQN